eukprot:TRINITY_DN3693_c0_g1_i3.p1 TRINITY_DN3693_c0_g1~~TRINITY_DN3693_c0_g1_i3.p1  ORF type:complete len:361 (-),score=4.27 TRINITY_DN3693_c0_g1_i3:100-1182(-)
MAYLRAHGGSCLGVHSGGFEYAQVCGTPYSSTWLGSGPPEDEVPWTDLSSPNTNHRLGTDQQRYTDTPQVPHPANPLPSSGSRRDSCGCWSVGSQGHEQGLCQGPCKDLRSGRGCTYGTECKKCHFPHPEVSSTSLRSKKSKARRVQESSEFAWGNGNDRTGFIPGHSSTFASSSSMSHSWPRETADDYHYGSNSARRVQESSEFAWDDGIDRTGFLPGHSSNSAVSSSMSHSWPRETADFHYYRSESATSVQESSKFAWGKGNDRTGFLPGHSSTSASSSSMSHSWPRETADCYHYGSNSARRAQESSEFAWGDGNNRTGFLPGHSSASAPSSSMSHSWPRETADDHYDRSESGFWKVT